MSRPTVKLRQIGLKAIWREREREIQNNHNKTIYSILWAMKGHWRLDVKINSVQNLCWLMIIGDHDIYYPICIYIYIYIHSIYTNTDIYIYTVLKKYIRWGQSLSIVAISIDQPGLNGMTCHASMLRCWWSHASGSSSKPWMLVERALCLSRRQCWDLGSARKGCLRLLRKNK